MLPAYAGMIPSDVVYTIYEHSAPRVCGDDPTTAQLAANGIQCSPRMRG